MGLWQGKSKRKTTGGRRVYARGKRKTEIGSEKQTCVVGDNNRKLGRVRAGHHKVRALSLKEALVLDPKTNKVKKVEIQYIVENPANPHYVQRSIITKGATIQTKLGKAKVTSRPGQHGVVNAVLIK